MNWVSFKKKKETLTDSRELSRFRFIGSNYNIKLRQACSQNEQ